MIRSQISKNKKALSKSGLSTELESEQKYNRCLAYFLWSYSQETHHGIVKVVIVLGLGHCQPLPVCIYLNCLFTYYRGYYNHCYLIIYHYKHLKRL